MIKFGNFPFSQESKNIIADAVSNYWEKSRIEITGSPGIDAAGGDVLDVCVTQKEVVDEKSSQKKNYMI